jgi:rhomboid protease GluP
MDHIDMRPEDYRVEEASGGPAGDPWGAPDRPLAFAGRETFLDRADIVVAFLALFGLLYVIEMFMGAAENPGALIVLGANYGAFVDRGEVWRLVTANFLHGGLMHLFVNGYSFYILGRFVERIFGRSRLALVFICTAVFASFVSWQANGMISVGASGGITGLLGLLTAFTLRYRDKLDPRFRSNFLSNLLFIVGINVLIAVMDPRIDNWAHAGGFAAGFLFGWVFVPAVLFQKHSATPYLKWAACACVFIILAAFAAQAYSFTFTAVIPEKGIFRSVLAAEGSIHLAYPALFESQEEDDELFISNNFNRALRFRLMRDEDVRQLAAVYSDAQIDEGQMNGQKTMRISTQIADRDGRSGWLEMFLIAAPERTAQAGNWATLRIIKPGRVSSAEVRLLDACARRTFFTAGAAI